MDELTDLIVNELGQKAINDLPDMFARGWNIPVDNSLREEVKKVASKEKCWVVQKLLNKIQKQKVGYNGSYRTSIAARIPGHDLRNVWVPVECSVDAFSDIGRNIYFTERFEKGILTEKFLIAVTPYRAFCLAMAYLASDGDNKFTFNIPITQIRHFLQGSGYEFSFKTGQNDEDSILSPEYVAMLEIVKNAPKTPVVSYRKNDDYSVIRISDSGKGIMDEVGKPLLPERLREIFGMFTTKSEGGLGLQVAKELANLRGGHLVVETTTEGSPTFSYSTKTDTVKEVPSKGMGTTFEICVPVVQ